MKILILHNSYKQPGGEDSVVEEEKSLLVNAGHEVRVEIFSNNSITSIQSKLKVVSGVRGNSSSAKLVASFCSEFSPEIVHIHNFFPILSPAAHIQAAKSGAAIVQTLHNYRLICANGMLVRDGKVCEACLHNYFKPALLHKCYRGSLPATAAVLAMQRGTVGSDYWLNSVDKFIALTSFGLEKFVQSGIPRDKIVVKPNFASGIKPGPQIALRENCALFVGRLITEKGVHHLVKAWKQIPEIPLKIIGSGPEYDWLVANSPANVEITGSMPRQQVIEQIRSARLLVFPSLWYEGFPMTIIEALASGTPILAGDIGATREIILESQGGALYPSGNTLALTQKIREMYYGDLQKFSKSGQSYYQNNYGETRNLELLEEIYRSAKLIRSQATKTI